MESVAWLIAVVVVWLVMGIFGAWIASQKNRSIREGFWLGLLFGPLGVVVEALLPGGNPPEPINSPTPAPKRWEKPLRQINDRD